MQSVGGANRQTVDERCQAATAAAAAAEAAEQSGTSMHPDELDKAPLQRVRLSSSPAWKPQGTYVEASIQCMYKELVRVISIVMPRPSDRTLCTCREPQYVLHAQHE